MATPVRYYVYQLFARDDPQLPRYIGVSRHGECNWLPVWTNRAKLQGPLARWFRELSEKPIERPMVGGAGVLLSERAARSIATFRIGEVNRMATGNPDTWADFLVNQEPVNTGRRGRPCAVVEGDKVRTYPSVSNAAAAEGVSRGAVSRRIRQGRLCRGGAVTL